MILTSSARTSNIGFGLGEPFDRHAWLRIVYLDARKRLQWAQVNGSHADILNAEWDVAEALGKVEQHERGTADVLLYCLRMAVRHYPQSLADLLSEVRIAAGQDGAS